MKRFTGCRGVTFKILEVTLRPLPEPVAPLQVPSQSGHTARRFGSPPAAGMLSEERQGGEAGDREGTGDQTDHAGQQEWVLLLHQAPPTQHFPLPLTGGG